MATCCRRRCGWRPSGDDACAVPPAGGAGRPFVDIVAAGAGRKGTGRWTVRGALDPGSPATAIARVTFARAASGQAALCTAYAGLPGEPDHR
ncbi:hypothetical protein [Streptomyces sp. NPDC091040]|uniref:hypothetical protein n=1 Tax=Streptomyces sp. NPDC091040 TaxID=3365972 RepID=UPI00380AC437